MSSSPAQADQLHTIDLLKLIVKWKKQLIISGIASLAFAIIFTMPAIMKPVYKATAIVYPANIQPYSEESPTEQLVQLLQSEDVWFKLVDSLDLYKHYGVDPNSETPRFAMLKLLRENLSINKTEFESVEIDAYDTDPKMSADICNTLLAVTDQKAIQMLRERSNEQMIIMRNLLGQRKQELDSLESCMLELRTKYGITDFEKQISGFSREYYKNGGVAGARLENVQKNLTEKGEVYLNLKNNLERVRAAYNEAKVAYDRTLLDLNKNLSFHNNVTKALPPQRKDSPKRTLIIALFTVAMLFVSVLVIIYQERYKAKVQDLINSAN